MTLISGVTPDLTGKVSRRAGQPVAQQVGGRAVAGRIWHRRAVPSFGKLPAAMASVQAWVEQVVTIAMHLIERPPHERGGRFFFNKAS